jgi:hypothetical protein
MRYLCFVNQHSISYAGIVVLFLSMLFRGISSLLLTALLVHFFQDQFSISLFVPLLFFILLIWNHFWVELWRTILGPFFNHTLSKTKFPGNIVSFWANVTVKNSLYCYNSLPQFGFKNLCCVPEKIFYKFNIIKPMWLFFASIKLCVYTWNLITVYFYLEIGPTFIILLIGFISEVLSHIFRLIYFKFCHVWKDILPVKGNQKRNLKIFDTKFEIIPDTDSNTDTDGDEFHNC